MSSFPLVNLMTPYFAAIVAVLGISMFKKANLCIRFLTALTLCHSLFTFFAPLVTEIFEESSSYFKLVLPIYFIFTFLFFFYLDKRNAYRKLLSMVFGVGAIVIVLIYFDSFGNIYDLSKSILLLNLVSIFAALLYFILMLKDISLQPLLKQWRFILVLGFFFYSLVSSGAWMTDYIGNSLGLDTLPTRTLNAYIYIIQMGIFFWGLWVYRSELRNNQKLKRKDYVVD